MTHKNERKREMHPAVVGLIGAGVAVGGALIAVFLSRKENRDRAKEKLAEWGRRGRTMVGAVSDRVDEYSDTIRDQVEDRLRDVRSTVDALSNEIEKPKGRRRKNDED